MGTFANSYISCAYASSENFSAHLSCSGRIFDFLGLLLIIIYLVRNYCCLHSGMHVLPLLSTQLQHPAGRVTDTKQNGLVALPHCGAKRHQKMKKSSEPTLS